MESLIIFGAKYLIVVLVAIAGVYFLRQSKGKRKTMAFFAIITLPAVYVVAKISSLLYFDPRPFVVGDFTPLIAHASDNGFPSDHTLLSVAVAMIIYFFNKKIGVILLFLAFLVGISRVLAGVHHSLDITGSFVIAITVPLLIYRFVFPMVFRSSFYRKLK